VIAGAQGLDILDRNGELIFSFSDEPGSGRVVPLEEISPHLVNATLAAEDAEFWDHPGVNPKGLVRAAYENVAFWETGGLFKGSGGSSITQQLAKNLYIKPEDRASRNPLRKLNETMIAFELTRRYSKQQILEWYLSNNYYGNGAFGIESASHRYFSKPPSDLTLAEAALLAGLPRAPSYYDPIAYFEVALQRQEEVMGLMVRHGFIEQAEMDAALASPVVINEGRAPGTEQAASDLLAPHFAEYVREQLPALLGQENVQGHLEVTTTLDLDLQAKAVQAITDQIAQLESQGVTNGALVAIDPATGEIVAMVGSYDFTRDDISGQVNNATALNQPGSTIKPVTYLATFLNGWSPQTTVVDEPITLGQDGDAFQLGNADGWHRGEITVATALGSSLNVPAVKALESVGLQTVYDLSRRMGVTTLRELGNYGPSFTLGGADVTLLDMTYVFSVLANYGEQAGMPSVLGLPRGSRPLDPIAVLKVEDGDGNVLWEADHRRTRITPADETFMITEILSNDANRVSMFGANSPLNLPRPAAVKSGSSDETRDAWTLGYTPQLVAGVWVGNANNDPIPNGTSTYTAAPIWRNFMLAALEDQPALAFQRPADAELERQAAERARQDEEQARKEAERRQKEEERDRKEEERREEQDEKPGQSAGLKATPEASSTPEATDTPEPTRTPRPTRTPQPTPPPEPTSTPAPTEEAQVEATPP
jgi:membrane peptidoglycan carboxypeptidase